MAREFVESAAISAVQYDQARRHLDVDLTTGRRYRYLDVPSTVYQAFMAAESVGRFYSDHIRDEYDYVRLR
jgi:KTSC domain